MIEKTNPDGSTREYYEEGDIVRFTETDNYESFATRFRKGEYGRVVLTDPKDIERGHTSDRSFVNVITAGISTPKQSLIGIHTRVPVWVLKHCKAIVVHQY